jgi:hypothetical protein
MMFRFLLSALLLLASSTVFAQSSNLTFPRLGLIAIGSPHDYDDPAKQAGR